MVDDKKQPSQEEKDAGAPRKGQRQTTYFNPNVGDGESVEARSQGEAVKKFEAREKELAAEKKEQAAKDKEEAS